LIPNGRDGILGTHYPKDEDDVREYWPWLAAIDANDGGSGPVAAEVQDCRSTVATLHGLKHGAAKVGHLGR
jgi:hypothetical protein